MAIKRFSLLVLFCLFFVSACQPKNPQSAIRVEGAWVRAASAMTGASTPAAAEGGHATMGANSAAYLTLRNTGGTADKLLKVDCDAAQAVELHQTSMQDGVMRMQPVDGIEIPANGEAKLEPGGLHVMLIGLQQDLVAGEKLKLILVFENAGEIAIEAEIRTP